MYDRNNFNKTVIVFNWGIQFYMHLPKIAEGKALVPHTAVSHQRAAKVCWFHAVYAPSVALACATAQNALVSLPITCFSLNPPIVTVIAEMEVLNIKFIVGTEERNN